ncbi:MAG: bifunctional histidinol-phosphatase/imidazoleglycerol-phosphate dehydratase HisB [Bacteroidetes bacterium]|nr:MAG: bifunctional histidinol-phosphatase/imidazoleglycerol-phosphate dehydratase HisB [Bacteroidota bacterium]
MKPRLLILDRDGTLIVEPPEDFQVDSLQKLEFLPGVIRNLYRIVQQTPYHLVMITNQDGLGTDSFPEDDFWPVHNKMMKIFENEGITFSSVHIDRTFKHEGAPTRKPGTALLEAYLQGEYDLENSFVVGDRSGDIQLAKNLGAKGILIGQSQDTHDDDYDWEELADTLVLRAGSWDEIGRFLLDHSAQKRTAKVHRQTKETDIEVVLQLDGRGTYDNHTGIGFFDHMLDQLARHSLVDLRVRVKGDLHIDEHHTIEDTAIALGTAFRQALGDKRGIERYGCFQLPMDEALARVALDFSGRSWLVWKARFRREKVGDMPTEMVHHFFKSFCDAAACNLNVELSGENDHHQIEALFKGMARCIRQAVSRKAGDDRLPSTKGVL